jgi:hypothetical protein
MTIKRTQKYTPRPRSSKFGDALGGQGQVNLEMHFEAVIERVWRCNWRLRLSELRDGLGGEGSSEFGDALGGRDRGNLEMHWEAEVK